MRDLNRSSAWPEIGELVAATPAGVVLGGLAVAPATRPSTAGPNVRQRLNIGLVTMFSQAMQITLVALALTGFFVAVRVPRHPGGDGRGVDGARRRPRASSTWTSADRTLVLSEPLMRVAGFLGAFTGMYFTVVLSTDADVPRRVRRGRRPADAPGARRAMCTAAREGGVVS